VRVPLPVSMSPIKGSTTMSESQLSALSNGKCYVNVHTDANKGGEIRGQLVRAR
jgi:CHRD domain